MEEELEAARRRGDGLGAELAAKEAEVESLRETLLRQAQAADSFRVSQRRLTAERCMEQTLLKKEISFKEKIILDSTGEAELLLQEIETVASLYPRLDFDVPKADNTSLVDMIQSARKWVGNLKTFYRLVIPAESEEPNRQRELEDNAWEITKGITGVSAGKWSLDNFNGGMFSEEGEEGRGGGEGSRPGEAERELRARLEAAEAAGAAEAEAARAQKEAVAGERQALAAQIGSLLSIIEHVEEGQTEQQLEDVGGYGDWELEREELRGELARARAEAEARVFELESRLKGRAGEEGAAGEARRRAREAEAAAARAERMAARARDALQFEAAARAEEAARLAAREAQLVGRLEAALAELNASHRKSGELVDKVVRLESEVAEGVSVLATKETTLAEVEGRLEMATAELDETRKSLETAQESLQNLQREVEEERARMKDEMSGLKSERDSFENEIVQLSAGKAALEREHERVVAKLVRAIKMVMEGRLAVERLEAEAANTNLALQRVEADKKHLLEQLEEVKEVMDALKGSALSGEFDKNEIVRKISEAMTKDIYDRMLKDLKKKLASHESKFKREKAELENRLHLKQKIIEEKDLCIQSLQDRINMYNEEMENARDQILKLKQAQSSLQNQILAMEMDKKEMVYRLREVEGELKVEEGLGWRESMERGLLELPTRERDSQS